MTEVLFRKPDVEEMGRQGYYGVDMHFHSVYSHDGWIRSRDVVKLMHKHNTGVAVADHNSITGAEKVYRNKKGALVIPAIEVTVRKGAHVLVYFYGLRELQNFYKKEIQPNLPVMLPYALKLSLEELLERTEDYNCVVCAPHPFGPFSPCLEHTTITSSILRRIRAVEVINGYNLHKDNLKALDWALKHKKAMTGGTDGHTIFEFAKVLTFAESASIEGFMKAVLKKKVKIIGKEDPFVEKAMATCFKQGMYLTRSLFNQTLIPLAVSAACNQARFTYNKATHKANKRNI
jgi:predicted metal-dependent phosphoesterase TrpH